MAENRSTLAAIEENLELYLGKKAPALPSNIKDLLVKLAPWITLILLILTLPLVLFAIGLGAIVAPFAFVLGPGYGVSYGVTYTLSMLILAVSLVLEALSIPGLFKRSAQGWRYAYYATLVGVVSSLVSLHIVSAVVSGLIGFYILFQIRSYYHDGKSEVVERERA